MANVVAQPVETAADPTGVVTHAEIFKYYFPKASRRPPGNSYTLNSSEDKPGKLAFIKVFGNGPRTWETSRTLYVKTWLNLLPPEPPLAKGASDGQESTRRGGAADTIFHRGIEDGPHLEIFDKDDNIAGIVLPEDFDDVVKKTTKKTGVNGPVKDYSPGDHDPIALYMNVNEAARTYRFDGWYKISHIAVYASQTRGLTRMLKERWAGSGGEQSERRAKATQRERERDWARVELAKMDPVAENCPPPPVIGEPATRRISTTRINFPETTGKKAGCAGSKAQRAWEGSEDSNAQEIKHRPEATRVREMVDDCKRGIEKCKSGINVYQEDFERMVKEHKKKIQSAQEDLERQLHGMKKKVAEWETAHKEQQRTASTGGD